MVHHLCEVLDVQLLVAYLFCYLNNKDYELFSNSMKWINMIYFQDFIKDKIMGIEERDYIMQKKKKMGSVWGKYFLTKKPIKWLKSPLWEEVEASSL